MLYATHLKHSIYWVPLDCFLWPQIRQMKVVLPRNCWPLNRMGTSPEAGLTGSQWRGCCRSSQSCVSCLRRIVGMASSHEHISTSSYICALPHPVPPLGWVPSRRSREIHVALSFWRGSRGSSSSSCRCRKTITTSKHPRLACEASVSSCSFWSSLAFMIDRTMNPWAS